MKYLDDVAHNRLYEAKYTPGPMGKLIGFVKVKHYGVRNKKYKCYCKPLATVKA